MRLSTLLSGQTFSFSSVKEVLAKANELKSGDVLAGVAASSELERVAAKEVLSRLLLQDLRENPVVPYEDDEVTRLNQDGITVVVIEHDMKFMMNLCGRIVVINYGQKLAEGAPAEVARDEQVIEAYLGAGLTIQRRRREGEA